MKKSTQKKLVRLFDALAEASELAADFSYDAAQRDPLVDEATNWEAKLDKWAREIEVTLDELGIAHD